MINGIRYGIFNSLNDINFINKSGCKHLLCLKRPKKHYHIKRCMRAYEHGQCIVGIPITCFAFFVDVYDCFVNNNAYALRVIIVWALFNFLSLFNKP